MQWTIAVILLSPCVLAGVAGSLGGRVGAAPTAGLPEVRLHAAQGGHSLLHKYTWCSCVCKPSKCGKYI